MDQQKADKKENWVPSLAVTILVTLLFWPVGVYFIYKRVNANKKGADVTPVIDRAISTSNKINSSIVSKSEKTQEKTRKINDSQNRQNSIPKVNYKVAVPAAIALVVFVIVGLVQSSLMQQAKKDEEAKYSVSFENAVDGEFLADCNLQEGTRRCSETRVEGTYNYGEEHYKPKIEGDAEITLKGDNSFVITFTSEIDQTTEEITKPVKIYFNRYDTETATSKSSFYDYDLLIRVKVTEDDKAKLNDLIAKEEAEAQRKAEEEAEKKRQEEETEKQRQAEAERKRQEAAANRSPSPSSSSSSSSNSSSSSSPSSGSSSTGWIKMRDGLEYKVSSAYGSYSSGIGHIKGTVKNSTKNTYSYGQLNFGIYNSSGSKVGSCMDNISNLRAGVSWEFDAACFTWPEGAKYALESFTFY